MNKKFLDRFKELVGSVIFLQAASLNYKLTRPVNETTVDYFFVDGV